jgi:hydroxyacylglutathione hydrolase
MLFRLIYDDLLAQAAYLIGCQRTGEAIVIDPERDIDRYLALAAAHKLRITAVTETHIHADFLSGTRQLAEATGAKVYLSGAGGPDWQYQWLNQKSDGGSYNAQLVKDGDVIKVGNIELKVLHTPGHTPEHICFQLTDRGGGAADPMGLVSGDFVFVGDVGRPDLLETAAGVRGAATDSASSLFNSVRAFRALPDYLQVWPGHGAGSACGKALGAVPQSTVGYEKRTNPALIAAENQSQFSAYVLEGQPAPPLYFARMKQLNKSGPPLLESLPEPRALSAADLRALEPRTVVLDMRPWSAFRAGHLPGALWCPLNANFAAVAGSYVNPDEPITLIAEPGQIDTAVRALVRIGLDLVRSYATPATLDTAKAAGLAFATTAEIDVQSVKRRLDQGDAVVLDVRRADEHATGSIAGSLNIAHTRLLPRLSELPKDRPLLVHCQGGTRSAFAVALLQRAGFDAANIAGGFSAWERAGLPVSH